MDQAGFDMEATFHCAVSTLVSPKVRVFPSPTLSQILYLDMKNFARASQSCCQQSS